MPYVRPSDVQAAVDLGVYALRDAPMGQPLNTPRVLNLTDRNGLVFTFYNPSAAIEQVASPAILSADDGVTHIVFQNSGGNLAPGETKWSYVYTTRDLARVVSGALWFYPYGVDDGAGAYDFHAAETLLVTPQIMEVFEQLPSEDPPPPPPPPPTTDPDCPVRPPWPYEELSIDVSQGPSGAMRYRNVRQR